MVAEMKVGCFRPLCEALFFLPNFNLHLNVSSKIISALQTAFHADLFSGYQAVTCGFTGVQTDMVRVKCASVQLLLLNAPRKVHPSI